MSLKMILVALILMFVVGANIYIINNEACTKPYDPNNLCK